jgi:hypothetical protein
LLVSRAALRTRNLGLGLGLGQRRIGIAGTDIHIKKS